MHFWREIPRLLLGGRLQKSRLWWAHLLRGVSALWAARGCQQMRRFLHSMEIESHLHRRQREDRTHTGRSPLKAVRALEVS